MEETVNKLEAMFQKTESDLNYISLKLECEIENQEGYIKDNPPKLLAHISDVKREHTMLMNDVNELQKMQKETFDSFKTEISSLSEMLQSLQNKTDITTEESARNITNKVEELLAIKLPQPTLQSNLNSSAHTSVTPDSAT